CLDRHVKAGKGSKIAYYWEGEPGDSRAISYQDLLGMTSRAANALKELGVRKGDRVAIYMPMIPELPAAMLACARIGAPFTVVFGGFSAEALSGRINDSEAKVLITADGGYRKGSAVALKKNADDAVAQAQTIEKVLVVRRTKQDVPWTIGRDVWWHDLVDKQKPECPAQGRWWSIIEKYKVSILYCAPTAIRTFMKWGAEYPNKHDMKSLRLLGSVGEPINPEAWLWYHQNIGGTRCPIVDTWWMTETGMILITPLPGITTTKPGSATFPFPGVGADVVDEDGKTVPLGGAGYLVITKPWPAMLRGIYKDDKRYRETYWSRYPGWYFAGDCARRDKDGYFWLMGRVDDVMKISGHRISTTEVESALVSHPKVAESAVIGREDPVTGQAIFAF